MGVIEKNFAKVPSTPIYHYSSQAGFLGIINNRSIWATNISYLNDVKELHYAIDLTEEVIQEKKEFCNDNNIEKLLNKLIGIVGESRNTQLFVCSFSENGDLLSQWRGYCPNGNGFSIGFEHGKVRELAANQKLILAPCVYDTDEQTQIIKELLGKFIEYFRKLMTEHPSDIQQNINVVCTNFVTSFEVQAVIIKHPGFSEEKEWRVISHPSRNPDLKVHFREGPMLTPYSLFSLGDSAYRIPLHEVIVGPSLHQGLAENATRLFLNELQLDKINVRSSSIPYRG